MPPSSGKNWPFSGFIIQAQDENDKIIGTFKSDSWRNYQLMQCNGIEGNSITHVNPNAKTSVNTIWQIPDGFNQDAVVFKATIVYEYSSGQKIRNRLSLSSKSGGDNKKT